jgi:phosphate:Na+ symporter
MTVLVVLGGLALFLLGIQRIAAALQSTAGPATRRWMASATRSPLRALVAGTAVSAATQSGTATAVTALGLVSGGLVAVREGIALSLGAKLGATLAIQLAAFKISAYALPLIGIGYLLGLWPRARGVGGLLLGAGLLFLGLDVTVTSMGGLSDSPLFVLLIDTLERQPAAMALLGVALGAMLSSANAAAAIALGLFAAGAVSLPTALALVVGGNVGGVVLPVLAARTLDAPAQRVALMHLLIKALVGTAAVLAVVPLAQGVAALGGDGARQVANAHTLFNVVAALTGALLAGVAATLAARFMPQRDDDTSPKYLRDDAIGDAHLATGLALRETVRISDHVAVMTDLATQYLRAGRWDPVPIAAREAKVDRLTQKIVDYLATLRATHGEDPDSERLLLLATELEHVGDQIRRLYRREQRLADLGVEFSKDGRAELGDTAERVLSRMRQAFTALATRDVDLGQSVIKGRPELEAHVARMRIAHLARLEARLPESHASSSHHLEVLTLLRQVDASVTRVAAWAVEAAS